jgi:hypothetical protein
MQQCASRYLRTYDLPQIRSPAGLSTLLSNRKLVAANRSLFEEKIHDCLALAPRDANWVVRRLAPF